MIRNFWLAVLASKGVIQPEISSDKRLGKDDD